MKALVEKKRFLNTRPKHQAGSLSQLITESGGEVVEFPTIEIRAVSTTLQKAFELSLLSLSANDWVFFTSANGVLEVSRYLLKSNPEAFKSLCRLQKAVVGEGTERALSEFGMEAAFCAQTANATSLGEEFCRQVGEGKGEVRALLFQGDTASKELSQLLERSGFQVTTNIVYESGMPTVTPEQQRELALLVQDKALDGIFSTSGEALRNLLALVGEEHLHVLREIPMFVIGPRTAEVARELGFVQVHQAKQPEMKALVECALHRSSYKELHPEEGARL